MIPAIKAVAGGSGDRGHGQIMRVAYGWRRQVDREVGGFRCAGAKREYHRFGCISWTFESISQSAIDK